MGDDSLIESLETAKQMKFELIKIPQSLFYPVILP